MSFKVLATKNFERELKPLAKKYRSIKNDLGQLIEELEENPKKGTTLGNGCYKIRISITSKGKGKSSGARVITHVYVTGKTVYLISIFDKSDKATISQKKIKELLKSIQDV